MCEPLCTTVYHPLHCCVAYGIVAAPVRVDAFLHNKLPHAVLWCAFKHQSLHSPAVVACHISLLAGIFDVLAWKGVTPVSASLCV